MRKRGRKRKLEGEEGSRGESGEGGRGEKRGEVHAGDVAGLVPM
jgi:hypothetical protein